MNGTELQLQIVSRPPVNKANVRRRGQMGQPWWRDKIRPCWLLCVIIIADICQCAQPKKLHCYPVSRFCRDELGSTTVLEMVLEPMRFCRDELGSTTIREMVSEPIQHHLLDFPHRPRFGLILQAGFVEMS